MIFDFIFTSLFDFIEDTFFAGKNEKGLKSVIDEAVEKSKGNN